MSLPRFFFQQSDRPEPVKPAAELTENVIRNARSVRIDLFRYDDSRLQISYEIHGSLTKELLIDELADKYGVDGDTMTDDTQRLKAEALRVARNIVNLFASGRKGGDA